MVLRDAIKSIKNVGVDGEKINSYARIIDPVSAKVALMLNGPLVIGLYCYNYGNRFWQGQGQNLGGHAVILTGWDKAGFVLQNSWGTGWGRSGVETFPFEKFLSTSSCESRCGVFRTRSSIGKSNWLITRRLSVQARPGPQLD